MHKKTRIFLLLLVSLVLFTVQKEVALAGFGVSPPYLSNKNLIPGSFYEQDVYLVQSQPDVDLNTVVTIDAGKINNWIRIENGNNFIIPKGTQQFPMRIDVTVPPNAGLGEYKGLITINTYPIGSQKSGVSVTLGGTVAVDLNVTSVKFSSFSIQNIRIPNVVIGSPINFIIKVKNDGNIDAGPTKVALTFFDKYHSKALDEQEQLISDKVPPFQTKDVSVQFKNNLDIGQYWADVKIYSDEKQIVDSKIVFFVVGQAAGEQLFAVIPLWAYLLAAAILIVLIFVLSLNKNRRHGRHNRK